MEVFEILALFLLASIVFGLGAVGYQIFKFRQDLLEIYKDLYPLLQSLRKHRE